MHGHRLSVDFWPQPDQFDGVCRHRACRGMKATETVVLEIPVPAELRDVVGRMYDAEVEVDVEHMVVRVTSSSVRESALEM